MMYHNFKEFYFSENCHVLYNVNLSVGSTIGFANSRKCEGWKDVDKTYNEFTKYQCH